MRHAITYRLDYGNALLYNIPIYLINRLLRVQNRGVRQVTGTRKREYITLVLFQLHCLPVRSKSLYTILYYAFKVLSGTAPLYLSELIQTYISEKMLRTESKKPYTKIQRYIFPSISSQTVG